LALWISGNRINKVADMNVEPNFARANAEPFLDFEEEERRKKRRRRAA